MQGPDVSYVVAPKGSNSADAGRPGGGPDTEPSSVRMSVLIVDDSEDTRYAYQRYFEFRGARSVAAADGEAALRAVRQYRPDVIVLDLAMPRVTGFDVLKALRAETATRNIPVIVLSGQQMREQALAAGATCYCEKPCVPEDLYAMCVQLNRDGGRNRQGD